MSSEQFDLAKATGDFVQSASTGFRVDLSDRSTQNCFPGAKSQQRDTRAGMQAGFNFDANGGLTGIDFGNSGDRCTPAKGTKSSKSTRVEVHADMSQLQANSTSAPFGPWNPARINEQVNALGAGFGASVATSETDVTRGRHGAKKVHHEESKTGFDVNVGSQSSQRETMIPGNPWFPAQQQIEQRSSTGASAKVTSSSSETDIVKSHGQTNVHHAEQKSTSGVAYNTGSTHVESDRRGHGPYLPAVHQTSDQQSTMLNWNASTQRTELNNQYNQFGWLTGSQRIDEGSMRQGSYQANQFRVITDQAIPNCWGTSTARRIDQGSAQANTSSWANYRVITDYGPIRRVL